jgi:hypothetical protein
LKYLIASGWWSCESEDDQRDTLFGDDAIRDQEFHKLWRECIDRFTAPAEILVIDSASPKKPDDIAGEKWLSMSANFGHATKHKGEYSGYTRAIFLSMMYAYVNDFDYWVYVEQDALIYGDGIIESTIKRSKKGVVYGSGEGTPQEIQQSLMIFKREKIIDFIKSYSRIRDSDKIISPEWKFLFAQNSLARKLPTIVLKWLVFPSRHWRIRAVKLFCLKIMKTFNQFEDFEFGFGRTRPLRFTDEFFYFQHGTNDETSQFKKQLRANENAIK